MARLSDCKFGILSARNNISNFLPNPRAIMKTFYKGASAVFLTYDITDEKSYNDLDYWYKQISN